VLFCALLLTGFADLQAAEPATITLFQKAEIMGPNIRLGDVARISGGDPAFMARLGEVDLGRAPVVQDTRFIDAKAVKNRLKQSRIDLARVQIQALHPVEVSRSSVEISPARIRQLISDYIFQSSPWPREKMNIKDIRFNDRVVLPAGEITGLVVPPPNAKLAGTVPFSVEFKVNGETVKKLWATADIEVWTAVVVTRRPLGRFQQITAADVQLERMDLAELPADTFARLEDVIGKRAKRTVHPKVVLSENLIELPPLIKRGDVVKIIAESPTLKLSALGVAKETGARGDRIRVENLDSSRPIYARVVDAGTVRIDF
jgi:flagella basal body P-ring formation protein FlgA